jgi:hypothetical protein
VHPRGARLLALDRGEDALVLFDVLGQVRLRGNATCNSEIVRCSARYRTPVQSIGRWKVTGYDVPVSLPGATARQVTIAPGDFEEVLERSEAIGRTEFGHV